MSAASVPGLAMDTPSRWHHARMANRPPRQRSSRRAYDLLRAYLREVEPGQRLPDEQVAALLNASRGSIRTAMQALVEEGVLTRAPRVGTTRTGEMMRVGIDQLTSTSMLDEAGRHRVTSTRLTHTVIPAAPYVRARLETADVRVQLVETLVSLDGTPMSLREAYLSASIPPELIYDDITDLETSVERVFGERVGEIESTIESISCSKPSADTLGVPPGAPMLLRETIVRGASGRALMLNFTQYRGDRVALTAHATGSGR